MWFDTFIDQHDRQRTNVAIRVSQYRNEENAPKIIRKQNTLHAANDQRKKHKTQQDRNPNVVSSNWSTKSHEKTTNTVSD